MAHLPALFVSHGAPTLALEPGEIGPSLARFARTLPKPRAVLVVSPHWSTAVPFVNATPLQSAIHDFYGFPEPLYDIQYGPPGAPAVAERVHALLADAGLLPRIDHRRGLDHGAWVPVRFMYPEADVPTLQLSLQPHQSPAWQYELGRHLAPLADEGVLVVGSGSITHNLQDFHPDRGDSIIEPYVAPFTDWIRERLASGDLASLLDYRARAPFASTAHPTDEHLLPLFVAMGAAGDWEQHAQIAGGIDMGFLAMDAYAFGTA